MMKQSNPRIRFKEFNNKWGNYKLGQFGTFKSGIGFPDSQQGGTEGIPFFKVSDMNNIGNETEMKTANNYVTQEQIVKNSWNVIKDTPAIIFAKVGAALMLNRKRLVTKPFLIDNNTMSYSLNKSWDKDFGLTLFHTIDLPKYAQIGALPSYNASDIATIKVNVPSIQEQSAIGSLFHTLDDLLVSYKDNFANFQSLKVAMLYKMFPKAGQTVPEIRLDGFEGEWEEKQFSKLVKRVTKSSDSDSLPKVEFEDIISGQGRLNKDISSKFDNRKGIHFKPGYTLYGKLRPYLNNWLLPKFEGVALGDFWVFDPNGNNSDFIYYLVQSSRYQKVANDTSGTKMPRSDWKSVSTTIFAIPQTIAEQQAIGAYFSNLDNLINSYQEKISQLETLKKKLLQDMFIQMISNNF